MAYALLAQASKSEPFGGSTATTASIDSTGGDLIVVYTSGNGSVPTLSDNKGNTFTHLTTRGGAVSGRLSYCQGATVGTGHTFAAFGDLPGVCVMVFSGSVSSPLDSGSDIGGSTNGDTTQGCGGTTTPSEANCLFATGLTWNNTGNGETVSTGFTSATDVDATGSTFGTAIAYEIQTTATGRNPTWTLPGSGFMTVGAAVFKAAGGGGGGGTAVPVFLTQLQQQGMA